MEQVEKIALTLIPGVGHATIREVATAGADLFHMGLSQLRQACGGREPMVQAILTRSTMAKAEQMLRDAEQHGVRCLFFTDADFPARLNNTEVDMPTLLFCLGEADLNATHTVSVVGSRKATAHGRDITNMLVRDMAVACPTVVSGLAYGIDTASHQAALSYGLPTVAVLGHGLDRIYPPENTQLARNILDHGGALLTEYPVGTPIHARQFPARNRIIAALGDATVVVEAKAKGGALITANFAKEIHRDVYAVPGRITDPLSEGCNNLIADGKARMLCHAADLMSHLEWQDSPTPQPQGQQTELFATLDPDGQRIVDWLRQHEQATSDELVQSLGMQAGLLSATLFDLEMQDIVRIQPGNIITLKHPII